MESSCALIIRGFSHCDTFKDTRGNILTYTLNDYKDNVKTCLLDPLRQHFDTLDVYVFSNNRLTDEEKDFFSPVYEHNYDGLESTQLDKLHEMCTFVPKIYSYYVIHRFDVLYKYQLSFSELKSTVVSPYRQNKNPSNVQWGLKHPLWNDVYFEIPSNHMLEFIDILKEQIRRKPMYHLMLHGVYQIYIERNIPVHFIHDGMYNIVSNPFFSFLRTNELPVVTEVE